MDTKFVDSLRAGAIEEQKAYLRETQELFDRGPAEMARMLGTNYNTYKAWLYGVNAMPGVVRVAIDCLIRNRPT